MSGVLILTERDIPSLLPVGECIDVMAEALAALTRGSVTMPLRTIVWLPDRNGLLVSMPVALEPDGMAAFKLLTVFPENRAVGIESHQGAVLLFELQHGRLLSILDATSITAIRTAAVSGVATRLLAREDAGDLAILGSGTQAGTHLEAMRAVRPIRRVRVWSRSSENARRFAERASASHGIEVEPSATAEDAVTGADLICTTTASREPVLRGEWLAPGAHVNAVGAVGADARELDTEAIRRSRLVVDRRESAVNEAGEFVLAKAEGAIGDDHIVGELGELVTGAVPGRRAPEEITVFRSMGIAVEDLAAAQTIHRRAVERGVGLVVDLGGGSDAGA
jgi:ornithine cyclodeaminase/alanine dehydrogenase-like protein (mu-crystallin family)